MPDFDERSVAIIGMSGRFPKSRSPAELWSHLVGGTDVVEDVALTRPEVLDAFDPDRTKAGKTYSRWGGLLEDSDKFDAGFFRISPREAEMMDPQQRLLLEVTWEALESAGYADGGLAKESGVFVGAMASEYLPHFVESSDRIGAHTITGNHSSVISNRVSYFLDLHGPSVTVDVACSSSLAALHLAVQSLRSGECPVALVGSTQAGLAGFHWVEFSRLGALSPTGRCRVFDSAADGYVMGEGVGCLVLRRLSDALRAGDRVLGVVRGVSIGHSGQSPGLTVPTPEAQARIFRRALADAGVSAEEISYVEAHGTGTALGDPVEIEGLSLAFRQETQRRQFCAIGSIKSNIGHLESAAGMAGLIKLLLCFEHGRIPANLHFHEPNRGIDFAGSPFYLVERTRAWRCAGRRRAAIHASGFGGSVAFAVLEEPPTIACEPKACDRPRHVLRLSGRSESALRRLAVDLAGHIERHPKQPLGDIAYSMNVGRGSFEQRLCMHAGSLGEIVESLRHFASGSPDPHVHFGPHVDRPKIAFVYPGHGSQQPGMGQSLFDCSPTFRDAIQGCAAFVRSEFDVDLLPILSGECGKPIGTAAGGRLALYAFEFAVSRLWSQWGVEPELALGHGLGEHVAAWKLGETSWDESLRRVARQCLSMPRPQEDAAPLEAFADGIRKALGQGVRVFVAIGPAGELVELGRRIAAEAGMDAAWIETMPPGRDDWWGLCDAVAQLDVRGVSLDGRGFDRDYVRQRVLLPTYPFERKSYWIGPKAKGCGARAVVKPGEKTVQEPGRGTGLPLEQVVWRPLDRRPPRPTAQGVWIVFVDRDGDAHSVVESLRSQGSLVAEVHRGNAYRKAGHGYWVLRSNESEDFRRVVAESTAVAPPVGVVYAWGLERDNDRDCAGSLMEFVCLVQALTPFERMELDLRVLAKRSAAITDAEKVDPSRAALLGLVCTTSSEYPRWRVLGVDIAEDAALDAGLADEILGLDARGTIAWRRGRWWTREMKEVEVSAPPDGDCPKGGAVVITGGLGGVGLALGRELSARGYRSLVLVSRTGVGDDERRRQAVRDMERLGATVECPKVDVAEEAAVRGMLEAVRGQFGSIVGIVHAAGVLADKLVRSLSRDDLDLVLGPKALGVRNLEASTRDDALSFFLVCSSVVSLEGNVGQGSYAAANAYMDAVVQGRRARGMVGTSVHWGPWQVGMAAKPELTDAWERLGVSTIDPIAGARMAADLLSAPAAAYAVIPRRAVARAPAQGKVDIDPAVPPSDVAKRASADAVRGQLRAIFGHVLGLPTEEVDVDTVFKDYGLDSILAEEAMASIRKEMGLAAIGVPVLFQHPTIRDLADYLATFELRRSEGRQSAPDSDSNARASKAGLATTVGRGKFESASPSVGSASVSCRDIAVIGYACRFPGAASAEEFWSQLLAEGVSTGPAPDERWELLRRYYPLSEAVAETQRPVGGWLTSIDQFDPYFFRMRPADAAQLDPRQRLFLEVAYRSLEHAGYAGNRLSGTRTGIFVGIGTQDYAILEQIPPESMSDATGLGSAPSILASRLAFLLDLRGPCVPVDTACSSALVAVHLAMESLRRGEIDTAVAGAVHLNLSAYVPTVLGRMGVLSPTGVCRPFGEGADGMVPSEGVGSVVLKRLDDALAAGDMIHVILKGSAVNNDGRTNGIAAPNPEAQKRVLLEAWRDGGVDASTVGYVEAHGTGTALGDPIEIEGLAGAFSRRPSSQSPCLVGSVKGNIGHADIAAGMAGLIKTILSLKHGLIPATPNIGPPNPRMGIESLPLQLASRATGWPGPHPRRAGVSAFGFAGVNAHVVVEEAPAAKARARDEGTPELIVLSARNSELLRRHANQLLGHIREHPELRLRDIAFTLAVGRMHLRERLAVVASGVAQLRERLEGWLANAGAEQWEGVYASARRATATATENGEVSHAKEQAALASMYVAGREIEWPRLFAGRDVKPVDLPGAELERTRCWVQTHSSRRMSPTAATRGLTCHEVRWQETSLGPISPLAARRRFLVLGSGVRTANLCRAIAEASVRVESIENLDASASMEGALSREWTDVVWVEPYRGIAALDAALQEWSTLVRRISDRGIERLFVVTEGAEAVTSPGDVHSPTGAGLRAAARVFAREKSKPSVSLIDVDSLEYATSGIATMVLADQSAGLDYSIREGRVRRAALSPLRESPVVDRLRQHGVYVITGALGGLGQALSRWLAKRYRAKLVLLSRRPLGEARRLKQELRSLGSTSLTIRADVCDLRMVREAIDLSRRTFGPINGIFHLAGTAEKRVLAELTEGDIRTVLDPKVLGACHLDESTLDAPPSVFVLFSSVAGIEGNVFQTCYSAASAWLDGFAAWRTAQGRATVSIDWGLLSGEGMGTELADRDASSALDPEEAMEAMRTAIAAGRHRVVIARRLPQLNLPQPEHRIRSNEHNRLLDALTGHLAQILDVPIGELDSETSFVDFGMDSQLAILFVRRLEAMLGLRLPATLPFDQPNLRRLAEFVARRLAGTAADGSGRPRGRLETLSASPLIALSTGRRVRVVKGGQ